MHFEKFIPTHVYLEYFSHTILKDMEFKKKNIIHRIDTLIYSASTSEYQENLRRFFIDTKDLLIKRIGYRQYSKFYDKIAG